MKSKWLKRTLVLSSALLTLAACSSGEAETSNTEKNANNSSDGAADFSVVTVRWADWGDDFLKGFIEETEEEANVNVDWQVYLNSDWSDQKPIMMAGGDLPDAFLGSISLSDSDLATFKDYFIPLEDLIEENMPNLVAAMEEDPNMRSIVTNPDGHIYSLPKREPMGPKVANQVFINQKWLDNLGLDMPETMADFEKVVRAFHEEDANGNGDPHDEIVFAAGHADPVISYLLPFGTTMSPGNNGNWWRLVDGKPVFTPTSEEYKEGIAWMHGHYAEGYIDQEIFTQDSSMSDAKRQNEGDAIVGISVGWTPDSLFGQNSSEYVPLIPFEGPDGERYVHNDGSSYSRNEFMITVAAEDPAAILRWIDLFYTDDASIQTFYGSFGVGTEKNDDGTYTVLESPDGEADTFAWVNSLRSFGPKYVDDDFNDRVILPEGVGDGLKLELDSEVNEYARDPYPTVIFTQEELNRLSVIGVDIDSFIIANQATWVTEGGVDAQWDEYLTTLEQMGLEEYTQIFQDAYVRYTENN
jgi:putative aldouronate transport system substrate-binding protein